MLLLKRKLLWVASCNIFFPPHNPIASLQNVLIQLMVRQRALRRLAVAVWKGANRHH